MAGFWRSRRQPRVGLRVCGAAVLFVILLSQAVRHRTHKQRLKRDVLASTEIQADFIDPAAIDLAPLVNTLINSTQSASRQLFSVLSVTSHSSLALHKLTLLVYNISGFRSIESHMFQRRYCYCVTNETNDLTDFTAILLDVMGNSTSYLHELFKSASILSVSQRNDSECIYICVMAGRTDKELPQLWEVDSITPLFNQTIMEDPKRAGNISSPKIPVGWHQLDTNVSQISPSGMSTVLTSRVHSTAHGSSTTMDGTAQKPMTTTYKSTTTSPAIKISTPQYSTTLIALSRRTDQWTMKTKTPTAFTTMGKSAGMMEAPTVSHIQTIAKPTTPPRTSTLIQPITTMTQTTNSTDQPTPTLTAAPVATAITAQSTISTLQPAMTATFTTVHPTMMSIKQTTFTPIISGTPLLTKAKASPRTIPQIVLGQPTTTKHKATHQITTSTSKLSKTTYELATVQHATTTSQPPTSTSIHGKSTQKPAMFQYATTALRKTTTTEQTAKVKLVTTQLQPTTAPFVLTVVQPTPAQWSSVHLTTTTTIVSRKTTKSLQTEKPGCPWKRPQPSSAGEPIDSSITDGGAPTTVGPTVGAHKLQPCVLELCKFFSQCICRPYGSKTRMKRYCDDSHLWYETHTSEVCRRVRRLSFSRNLKQKCLARMCSKLRP